MPEVLLRRGSLVLLHGPGWAGLFRAGDGGSWSPPGALDRAEWHWLLVCAAPLALQVLGPEPSSQPEQTALKVDAQPCAR